jgi:hypothetical protein
MAGHVTFGKGPHPSRLGAIVAPRSITPAQRTELDAALGRALTDAEVNALADSASTFAHIRELCSKVAAERVTPADVRRTLAAIARCASEEDAIAAAENCDETSRALLDEAGLYPRGNGVAISVREAAEKARTLVTGARGRGVDGAQRMAIAWALNTWIALGGSVAAHVWERDGKRSPLLRFVATLANIAGWHAIDAKRVRTITRSNFSL